jgi:glycosyltransferase involved in cell wall biosynthesis
VLAYRVGGLPEVIADGEGGFLLPAGDVGGMTEKAIELLSTPRLWQAVSDAGVARARALFSAERIVPRYEEYYARVSEGAPRR